VVAEAAEVVAVAELPVPERLRLAAERLQLVEHLRLPVAAVVVAARAAVVAVAAAVVVWRLSPVR
jgi:hypothetical protein